jgi:hypothetical protein
MTEISERHNQAAVEIVTRVIVECPKLDTRLVMLESIMVGVIGSMPLKYGGDEFVFNLLREGALKRLADYRLDNAVPKGTG